ncbi:type III-B CRISPR module RAMP protein Cmr6 [Bacillus alveayuensis]|uniref:type III-B CRISPR module RAMP protein Cmr6 n=1 Tax=Aeribacillus alveayuensis TaxID=279215 RepID=UPI0005D0F9DD|nr:type III-B CRISPR module RAMP protein Cmr6 [Bacillus alveayuensis]
MLFHPIDTKEAFNPSNKNQIGHLWYHIHYNQMEDLKNTKNLSCSYSIHPELVSIANRMLTQRINALIDSMDHVLVKHLQAKPLARIIHGLGGGHVRETSITLHPVYGVPYIPSSSVKGVVRNWFIHAFCEGEEDKLADHELGSLIFGTKEAKGLVQFYDLFLIDDLTIEPDILTTLYKDYYGMKKAASDDQKPNPVSFLTAYTSSVDIFLTTNRYFHTDRNVSAEQLLEEAAYYTSKTLIELGIGSKTSSGYGYFTDFQDVTETKFQEYLTKRQLRKREEVEQKKREEEERRRRELEEKLKNMPDDKRLVFEIQQLTDKPEDQEKSKSGLYDQVIKQQNQEAAKALKEYWQKIGHWNVKKKKKKQIEKVQAIKQLINE